MVLDRWVIQINYKATLRRETEEYYIFNYIVIYKPIPAGRLKRERRETYRYCLGGCPFYNISRKPIEVNHYACFFRIGVVSEGLDSKRG